ncbi:MAG: AAA family ATPase [Lachnospiraceae bacterium]|nr:AAA family ATPase [Lachnospiraceae bacterium]
MLTDIVNTFKEQYVSTAVYDDEGNMAETMKRSMPIFVNYGVNRAVIDADFGTDNEIINQLDAFNNAIENRIDFKSFFKWFRREEDLENETIAALHRAGIKNENAEMPTLTAVRKAMLAMFPEFTGVRIDRVNDTLLIEKDGESLNISQLSDGEKCTIALFGDIARRMSIANDGVLLNPNMGEGIVLIDEVDLHLHPGWQRKVVGMLHDTFPNVQFILTTHSPQVLGEAGDDFEVYSLRRGDQGQIEAICGSYFGWDSNIILEEGMDTGRMSHIVMEHIENMYEAYEKGDLQSAEREADEIDELTMGHNDCVAGMRVMIGRKRRRKMNAAN